jgi:maltooligosyltrehalose trehalohydrolase
MRSRLGAHPLGDNKGVEFRVWAPQAERVELSLPSVGTRIPMQRQSDDAGVFACEVKELGAGTDYAFVLDGDKTRPDPRSRWQPSGVHGPSRVVDPARFLWSDAGFRCPALCDFTIYELHIGTFSPQGTFDGAIAQLPHLVELGVSVVEIMPINQFPGARNWGYDGVDLYAPQNTYGGPEGFARLVDACHAHGLAVMLDVVYNHVGPEGNYLADFGPYFTDRYKTDWGSALNFDSADSDQVRRFFLDNALYWLRDYHVDALRLDAIHAICDFSARNILEELRAEVDAQVASLGRPAYLIAESDLNDARVIRPLDQFGLGMHAQWSDDFHHSLRTLLAPSRAAYLGDFGKLEQLAIALTDGYVYGGHYSPFRRRRHGNSSRERPGEQFVVYQQNHDQVGNSSQGTRLATLAGLERSKLGAAVVLSAPNVPLLFMGEEFFAQTPFAYFVSHTDTQLSDAVRDGRKREHAEFGDPAQWLDPSAQSTFDRCKLDWSTRDRTPHASVFRLYCDLLALRKKSSSLGQCDQAKTRVRFDEQQRWLVLEREGKSGERACALFNFSDTTRAVPVPADRAWRRALATSDSRYGGPGTAAPSAIAADSDREVTTVEVAGESAVIFLDP